MFNFGKVTLSKPFYHPDYFRLTTQALTWQCGCEMYYFPKRRMWDGDREVIGILEDRTTKPCSGHKFIGVCYYGFRIRNKANFMSINEYAARNRLANLFTKR